MPAITLHLFLAACAATLGVYLELPSVSAEAVSQALAAVQTQTGGPLRQGTLIIVDYSQPSQRRRLAVMDLASGRIVQYSRTAHGKNSGGVWTDTFSNTEGSLQSSLGLFKVAESFSGKHGLSLRLIGLDPEKNSNALRRGIIVHAAPYASAKSMLLNWRSGFRLGRSEGCFALADDDFVELSRQLVRPAYLYSYAKE